MKITKPIKFLYHGTTLKNSYSIETTGLLKKNNDHVYLTSDLQVAYEYALLKQDKHSGGIVICVVDAVQMYNDGFTFQHDYSSAEWLVDSVPPKYLVQVVIESIDDLAELEHYANQITS